MLYSLISHFAPHYCLSCGEIGEQICENCFFDIELSPRLKCFSCHQFMYAQRCMSCHLLRDVTQIVLAEREGVLQRLIDEYKFSSARGAELIAARLLHENVPIFPDQSHLVPIPTIAAHIRQRGFDHTRDIARHLAKTRQIIASPIVERRRSAVQVGAGYEQRKRQAAEAYTLRKGVTIDPDQTYIIFDDIVTTGASMAAIVTLLKSHGARHIVCLALLQQPWQK